MKEFKPKTAHIAVKTYLDRVESRHPNWPTHLFSDWTKQGWTVVSVTPVQVSRPAPLEPLVELIGILKRDYKEGETL